MSHKGRYAGRTRNPNAADWRCEKEECVTQRDYYLSVRLKPEDKEQLFRLCQESGLPVSTLARQLIRRAEIKARPAEGTKELYLAVNRIGTNINQIAKAVNSGIATRNDIMELKVQMAKVEQLLDHAVNG